MLIHFLNEYSVVGRTGNKIKIRGVFPGITTNDYVYLGKEQVFEFEDEYAYKIEEVEYTEDYQNSFRAVIKLD